ncbi:hypothetical protein AGMMS49574_10940 [Bacteroidia bacterium]|nr:hypothetical protein AGMMS49574_10940 [Bacteroidia bacterium]
MAGLTALLSFSNCDKESSEMYGVPWASHAIKGTVVDKATLQSIPSIEVKIALPDSLKQYFPYNNEWGNKTDEKGEFKLANTPILYGEKGVPLVVTDIDGEANGLFETDTVYADFKNAQHIGGGKSWFQGELTATVKVELQEKKAK